MSGELIELTSISAVNIEDEGGNYEVPESLESSNKGGLTERNIFLDINDEKNSGENKYYMRTRADTLEENGQSDLYDDVDPDHSHYSQRKDLPRAATNHRKALRLVFILFGLVITLFVVVVCIVFGISLHGMKGTNGQWSDWSSWSSCSSSTCMKTRNRTCTSPSAASNSRLMCPGISEDKENCNLLACTFQLTNEQWSDWSSWSSCSFSTCMKTRNRTCTSPSAAANSSLICPGNSEDKQNCNLLACTFQLTNGQWSDWSSWSSCSSSTCMKTRNRSCTSPSAAANSSLMCPGLSEDKQNCNLLACTFQSFQVRLSTGVTRSGRLEVSLDGNTWGTICNDDFDINDAKVACRMLGYSGSAVLRGSSVISGSGPIYLSNLKCTGDETSLLMCDHAGWGKHNCSHKEDVGVSCA